MILATTTVAVAANSSVDVAACLKSARSSIQSGDYHSAAISIGRVRKNMVSEGAPIQRDYPNLFKQVLPDHTVQAALTALDDAEKAYSGGDKTVAVTALDRANLILAALESKQSPAQQYSTAKQALATTSASSPATLSRVARSAYKAKDFAAVSAYAQQELQASANLPPITAGWMQHEAHTLIGLVALAQGNPQASVLELKASLDVPPNARMEVQGPSMALAQALLSQNPTAVVSYLEKCSTLKWRDKDKAVGWKTQIQAGQRPDFGLLARVPVAP